MVQRRMKPMAEAAVTATMSQITARVA